MVELTNTRWGFYIVFQDFIRDGKEAKIKSLYIEPNKNISYQKHNYRGENWTVIKGSGTFVQDGKFYDISQGVSMNIPVGSLHSVRAGDEGLEIIEVQFGDQCREDDIVRLEYEWEGIVHFEGDEF